MSLSDHSAFYEILDALDSIGVVHRAKARTRTAGTPVLIYRVPEEVFKRIEPKLLDDVRRWGAIRNPRLPMMIDAWVCDGRFEYAQIEHSGVPLSESAGDAALIRSRRGVAMEVVFQTMQALCALHDLGISHESIRRHSYEVLKDGTIALRHNGLVNRINSHAAAGSKSDAGFLLSSNLMRHDVGDWALSITECLSGKMLGDLDSLTTPHLSPSVYEAARSQVRRTFKDKPLAEFMMQALSCRGQEDAPFDSALDARKAFEREFPKAVQP